jgi:hypothetical protein
MRQDCTVAESYYAARSRRDPDWRREQISGAAERERARRDADPELHRARRPGPDSRQGAYARKGGLEFG